MMRKAILLSAFAAAQLALCAPVQASDTAARVCLLIIADSTLSFKGYLSDMPAHAMQNDEWGQTMMGRARAFTSPELARDLKAFGPINIKMADFSTYVQPRTDWTMISNEKDYAAFGTKLANMKRIMTGGTHSYKALDWAIKEVASCQAERRVINFETDGTASDTRQDEYLKNGIYLDPKVIALTQAAYEQGITINALGIGYTTGTRPPMDNRINLKQVMQDNFRTPDGMAFYVKMPEEFLNIYRIKLRQDIAGHQNPVFSFVLRSGVTEAVWSGTTQKAPSFLASLPPRRAAHPRQPALTLH